MPEIISIQDETVGVLDSEWCLVASCLLTKHARQPTGRWLHYLTGNCDFFDGWNNPHTTAHLVLVSPTGTLAGCVLELH